MLSIAYTLRYKETYDKLLVYFFFPVPTLGWVFCFTPNINSIDTSNSIQDGVIGTRFTLLPEKNKNAQNMRKLLKKQSVKDDALQDTGNKGSELYDYSRFCLIRIFRLQCREGESRKSPKFKRGIWESGETKASRVRRTGYQREERCRELWWYAEGLSWAFSWIMIITYQGINYPNLGKASLKGIRGHNPCSSAQTGTEIVFFLANWTGKPHDSWGIT